MGDFELVHKELDRLRGVLVDQAVRWEYGKIGDAELHEAVRPYVDLMERAIWSCLTNDREKEVSDGTDGS